MTILIRLKFIIFYILRVGCSSCALDMIYSGFSCKSWFALCIEQYQRSVEIASAFSVEPMSRTPNAEPFTREALKLIEAINSCLSFQGAQTPGETCNQFHLQSNWILCAVPDTWNNNRNALKIKNLYLNKQETYKK